MKHPLYVRSRTCVFSLLSIARSIESKTQWKETPLHFAARGGKVGAVYKLITHGANVRAKDRSGARPEDEARRHLQTQPPGSRVAASGYFEAVDPDEVHSVIHTLSSPDPNTTPFEVAACGGDIRVKEGAALDYHAKMAKTQMGGSLHAPSIAQLLDQNLVTPHQANTAQNLGELVRRAECEDETRALLRRRHATRRQRDGLRHRLPAAGHGVGRVHADDERPAPAPW